MHWQYSITVDKSKNSVTKVYCDRCDLIFGSREKFEKHLEGHYSGTACEMCPIDTAISKIVGMFRRKSTHNLE